MRHVLLLLVGYVMFSSAFDFSFNSEIRRFDPVIQRAREKLQQVRNTPTELPLTERIESTIDKIQELLDHYQKQRERAKTYAEFVAGPLWMVNEDELVDSQSTSTPPQ